MRIVEIAAKTLSSKRPTIAKSIIIRKKNKLGKIVNYKHLSQNTFTHCKT